MAGATQPLHAVATLTLAPSGASVSGTLPSAGDSVLIQNTGTAAVFVRLDAGPATNADTPVLAGARLLMACPEPVTTASVFGTGTVYFTRCYGTTY